MNGEGMVVVKECGALHNAALGYTSSAAYLTLPVNFYAPYPACPPTSYGYLFEWYLINLHSITIPYHTLPYITLPFLTWPDLTVSYLSLPYLTVPYHTVHYLTWPYITSHYIAFHYLDTEKCIHVPLYISICVFSRPWFCGVCITSVMVQGIVLVNIDVLQQGRSNPWLHR